MLPQANSTAPTNQPGQDPAAESQHCPGSLLFRNFISDSAGPYPIFMGLATAGIHQATGNPPDWHQGFRALSERFGSNMGISAIGNAARYGLSCAMNVDTRFEKCHCTKWAIPTCLVLSGATSPSSSYLSRCRDSCIAIISADPVPPAIRKMAGTRNASSSLPRAMVGPEGFEPPTKGL